MQPGTTIPTFTPTNSGFYPLPAGLSTRRRIALVLTILVIIAILAASLIWLSWSGQQGLELGYPQPVVHINQLAAQTYHTQDEIQFSAQGTGRDLKYTWTFDDTSSANTSDTSNTSSSGTNVVNKEGQNVNFVFTSVGSHNVTVTVTDPLGHTSQDKMSVPIYPPKPIVTLTVDSSSFYTYVYFRVDTSNIDESTSIASCTWDFGDGTVEDDTNSYNCTSNSHSYSKGGTYTVKLVVTDTFGQKSDPATQTVQVQDS
ncbi:hypothetical protein KSD_88930 [Ktedonobacter sp. SOSP1-85]|uniref:PKD domain-containing protein n=1 Tax=Ktedonobacter sp. SOSP1-85 TaxID=2778367 RepID=UPI001914DDAE|nr:PKD domain-containing protein [Ktedonobacter sp. SOSP1-85]GHO81122.1 hypothetical protein KSD_88930 [Ktedonobacter sp. SOSP1-85]